jgi:DNA-binding transcriptional regulator YdaS (Cro superfamily)
LPYDGTMANKHDLVVIKLLEQFGGYRGLARAVGVTAEAIRHWKRVPAERVIKIEKVSGVAREQLRPDLYR